MLDFQVAATAARYGNNIPTSLILYILYNANQIFMNQEIF